MDALFWGPRGICLFKEHLFSQCTLLRGVVGGAGIINFVSSHAMKTFVDALPQFDDVDDAELPAMQTSEIMEIINLLDQPCSNSIETTRNRCTRAWIVLRSFDILLDFMSEIGGDCICRGFVAVKVSFTKIHQFLVGCENVMLEYADASIKVKLMTLMNAHEEVFSNFVAVIEKAFSGSHFDLDHLFESQIGMLAVIESTCDFGDLDDITFDANGWRTVRVAIAAATTQFRESLLAVNMSSLCFSAKQI